MFRPAALSIAILTAFSSAALAQESPRADGPDRESPDGNAPDEEVVPEAAPDPARPRVAVLLLAMGEESDPEVIEALNELLIGTIAARGGVTILGKEEFQAQLGQGDAGTLECVESMPCLGRVGVQLGVSEVVVGTLATRDGTWIFNLNRVDVRSGTIVGRVFRELEGDLGEVADALNDAIPELYETPVRTGTLIVTSDVEGAEIFLDGTLIGAIANGRLRRENVAFGEHEVRASAPGRTPWERRIDLGEGEERTLAAQLPPLESGGDPRLHPVFWTGLGIGVLSLAVAIPLAVSSQSQLELTEEARWTMETTRADAVAYYQDRTAEAIAANVLFVVSGLAATTALVWLFLPIAQATDPAPVDVAIGPGTVSLRGRFQ
jgi:hypothetical protein